MANEAQPITVGKRTFQMLRFMFEAQMLRFMFEAHSVLITALTYGIDVSPKKHKCTGLMPSIALKASTYWTVYGRQSPAGRLVPYLHALMHDLGVLPVHHVGRLFPDHLAWAFVPSILNWALLPL